MIANLHMKAYETEKKTWALVASGVWHGGWHIFSNSKKVKQELQQQKQSPYTLKSIEASEALVMLHSSTWHLQVFSTYT